MPVAIPTSTESYTYKELIEKYKGKVVPFISLPKEHQYAMIHYMAVDGEAWKIPDGIPMWGSRGSYTKHLGKVRSWIKKNSTFWIKKYAKVKFGMVDVPMDVLCQCIVEQFKAQYNPTKITTILEYHEQYMGDTKEKDLTDHYTELWPAILDSDPENDLLQDGWHRFHTYLIRKIKTMPLLYYP